LSPLFMTRAVLNIASLICWKSTERNWKTCQKPAVSCPFYRAAPNTSDTKRGNGQRKDVKMARWYS
jgi:hypothetical protein